MNTIYQLVICDGEWDSYRERVVFADTDLAVVRGQRDELKRRATEIAVANQRDGGYDLNSIYGWVAYRMEDEVTARIEEVALGGELRMSNVVQVIDREDWYMEMYENMSDEPWEPADDFTRYELLAEEFEKKFG